MKKLFFLFFLASVLYGEIFEISKMEQALPYFKKDSLIVFDIDNTLVEPVQLLGSDQWFEHRLLGNLAKGMNTADSLNKAMKEWRKVQTITEVQKIEESTPRIIADLQKKGFKVMALTTRGLDLSYWTIEQLRSIGIDFENSAPAQGEFFFLNNPKGVLVRQGIVFTDATDKGTAIMQYLKLVNYAPKEIVFINDKKPPLLDMEDDCDEKHIPFVGLRYGYLDAKVKAYDANVAQVEWQHFNKKILSDKEAKALLKKKT